ncbi:unnamed protein product [Rangifer tarandus platyrhynchus]|uniref:Uncharacterized protein n=1 Tax=Rangifer tarandus platyrhynchus TaxID=3082113 RepID=A0AC60A5F1_RANTA
MEQGRGSDPAAFTFHLRPSSFRLILYPLARLQPLRHTSAPKACALIGPYDVTGKMGVKRSLGRHRVQEDIGLDLTAADHGWCSNA